MRTVLFVFIAVLLATVMIFQVSYFRLPAPEYERKYPAVERKNNIVKQCLFAEGILIADLREKYEKVRK